MRDSGLRRFTFPAGASIPPNSSVTVYAGQGEPFDGEFFWNLTAPVFENVTERRPRDGRRRLPVRPAGRRPRVDDLPLPRSTARTPTQGQVSIDVNPKKDEIITLRNNAASPIDLEDYQLKSKPYSYSFPPGSILQPGETMRVSTQGDPAEDTQFDKFWGMTSQILNNGGDSVTLVSLHRRPARLHGMGLEVLLRK